MDTLRQPIWAARLLAIYLFFIAVALAISPSGLRAQGATSYTARTDRLVQPKTAMDPPAVNVPFQDPDFGSTMVRVTDQNTRASQAGIFYRNASDGDQNTWSADGTKFYVVGKNGLMSFFSFDPPSMISTLLPNIPLRTQAEFSHVDPDLIYGLSTATPYVIQSYRFSTASISQVFDTTTCGMQPALNPKGTSDTIATTAGDLRFSLLEGGTKAGSHMFIAVYDPALGCEWYNSQTGQIGGQWGAVGQATIPTSFTMRGAELSRDGNSVVITPNSGNTIFIWQVGTLNVTACTNHCGGYETVGYSHMVNSSGLTDEMNPLLRPFNDVTDYTQLVIPLKTPHKFGMVQRWAWINGNPTDTVPVCGTTYRYNTSDSIQVVWDGEIICLETDGAAWTVWRFAHNRTAVQKQYFNTEPLGNISPDGHYFLFTSDWDNSLGTEADGTPRSDVWILRLE